MIRTKKRNAKLVISSLILSLLLATFASCHKTDAPEIMENFGGDFTLTDFDRKPFHLSDLKGKVVLLYFGYTTCPDACPFTLSKIRRVYNILGKKSKNVQTVFVSVDPERDTPELLKKYLSYYKLGTIGVTGTPEEVATAARLYDVKYEKVDSNSAAGYLMDHTTTTFLIDPAGKVRYRFRHDDNPSLMASIVSLIVPSL